MTKALVIAILAFISLASQGSAQELKRYDVLRYEGTIELDRQDTFIRGHVKMSAICTTGAPVDRVLQHLIYLNIDSVLINGVRATIEWTGKDSGEYYVVPPVSMQIPGYFTVETFYGGKPLPEQTANKWGGVSNRGGMMFAMGVGFQAPYISCTRHWLPCYDLPDDKADSARFIFVSKNASDVIAASGQLERVFDTLGGKAYDWNMMHPIATYLMTFAQGPFEMMEIDNPVNVQFEAYAFAADTAKTRRLMERRVVRGLEYFDSLFTPYPFEKVGYVVAPIGSMEHQTMITLDRRTLDTNNTTAIHELAHMWWGDLVTCHTFADPWLNEGFATFSESLYLERFEGKQAYRKRQWSKIQSAKKSGSDYPMYGAPYHTNHTNNYPSAVIYDKGAAVLGMLRYLMQSDLSFFHALRTYLEKYKYSTATSEQLREHLRQYLPNNIDWFFDQWVFGKGYPKLDITWTPGLLTSFEIRQTESNGLFRLPIVVEATSAEGVRARGYLNAQKLSVTNMDIDFGFMPVSVQFDPDSVLIADFNVQQSGVADLLNELISVSPNPAGNTLIIGMPTQLMGSQVLLLDSGGRTLLERHLYDRGPLSLDVSHLPSGSYRLIVNRAGNRIHSQQVVIQR